MPKSLNKIIIWALIIWAIFYFYQHGGFMSAVIFEGYNKYDDRVSSPILYSGNYETYNIGVEFMNRQWEIPDLNNIQCKANTCSGTQSSTDSYGCPIYTLTTRTRVQSSTHCSGTSSNGCTSFTEGSCSGGHCYYTQTKTTVCGGANNGTCSGNDCIVKGTCTGDSDNHDGKWATSTPLTTLTSWLVSHNNSKLGVNMISVGSGYSSDSHSEAALWYLKYCRPSACPTKETYYSDEYWKLYANSGRGDNGDGGCTNAIFNLPTASNPLKLSGTSTTLWSSSGDTKNAINPTIKLITKKIKKGDDIKIIYSCSGGITYSSCSSSGASCTRLPDCSVTIGTTKYTVGTTSIVRGAEQFTPGIGEQLIEMFSSKLDPNVADIYIDGQFKETLNFASISKFNITFIATGGSPVLDIKQFGFMVPFDCVLDEQEMLGEESFIGPRSLSITDLRYAPTGFCTEHPVIITSSTGSGSTTTNEVYDRLRTGKVMQIPETQTWTVFYKFYNDGSIPMVCGEQQYDIANNRCVNTTGITYFCSAGTFDPSIGTCVVTPEQSVVCPYGRYDVDQDRCVYNPPMQAVCELGDYNSVTGKCEYKPESSVICQSGYIYNTNTKFCESYPEAVIVCEPTFSYNSVTSKCEKIVPTDYLCDGDWNPTTKVCTKNVVPNINRICPTGTNLFQDSNGNYACIYEPDLTPKCMVGTYDANLDKCVYVPAVHAQCGSYTYDASKDICIYEPTTEIMCPQGSWNKIRNACVVSPDISYLCINGELSLDKTICTIIPRTKIICPSDTVYDEITQACIKLGNTTMGGIITSCPAGSIYNSDTKKCTATPNTVISCPAGSTYNSEKGICTKGFSFDLLPLWFYLVILIALYYFIFEKGPKKGIFRR